jgi:glycosyltransferase involved in cell wall biosynthesis
VRAADIPLETIPERGAFDLETVRALRALAVRVSPDVLQTHAVKSHFLVRLAGLDRSIPWIAFHHGYTWPTLRTRLYNQLDRWSLRRPRRVITVSQPFRDELVRIGVNPAQIEIVHNSIAADWGRAARQAAQISALRAGIESEKKVLLIVGRLSREKDHLTLFEALRGVRASLPAHLVVVGDGPERTRLEEAALRMDLKPHVTFTGHQPSAAPWYGLADVVVLSSLSEGSPNALLEAMAAGVPVVATRVGGVPEIVQHGESALLVEPGDPAGMRAALIRILTDPALSAGLIMRGKELILERHEPEARAQRLVSIYRSVAESSPPRTQSS